MSEHEPFNYRIRKAGKGYEEVKVPANNADGYVKEFRYVGEYYVYDPHFSRMLRHNAAADTASANGSGDHDAGISGTAKVIKQKAVLWLWIAEVLSILLLFLGLKQFSPLNLTFWAGGIGMFSLAAELFSLLGLFFFTRAPLKMRIQDFSESRNTLFISSMISTLIMAAGVVGCLVYLILYGITGAVDILVPVCFLATGLLKFWMMKSQALTEYRQVPNEDIP